MILSCSPLLLILLPLSIFKHSVLLQSIFLKTFSNIPFLLLLWFTVFFKSLSTLSWFLLWTLPVVSCTPQSRTSKSLSIFKYRLMLIVTPLTVDDSSLMSFILTFSHLSQGNKKLFVIHWSILCTSNIKSLNLQCSFFIRLFFTICILQFWRTPSSRSERRIFKQSQSIRRTISQLYKLFFQFNLTSLWCIGIRQSHQKSLITSVHWLYILRAISARSYKMKFWHKLLLWWLGA